MAMLFPYRTRSWRYLGPRLGMCRPPIARPANLSPNLEGARPCPSDGVC